MAKINMFWVGFGLIMVSGLVVWEGFSNPSLFVLWNLVVSAPALLLTNTLEKMGISIKFLFQNGIGVTIFVFAIIWGLIFRGIQKIINIKIK